MIDDMRLFFDEVMSVCPEKFDPVVNELYFDDKIVKEKFFRNKNTGEIHREIPISDDPSEYKEVLLYDFCMCDDPDLFSVKVAIAQNLYCSVTYYVKKIFENSELILESKQNAMYIIQNQQNVPNIFDSTKFPYNLFTDATQLIGFVKSVLDNIISAKDWVDNVMALYGQIKMEILNATSFAGVRDAYRKFPTQFEAIPKPSFPSGSDILIVNRVYSDLYNYLSNQTL